MTDRRDPSHTPDPFYTMADGTDRRDQRPKGRDTDKPDAAEHYLQLLADLRGVSLQQVRMQLHYGPGGAFWS